jgi:hypothetical protein
MQEFEDIESVHDIIHIVTSITNTTLNENMNHTTKQP